jgi:hypothetical protein
VDRCAAGHPEADGAQEAREGKAEAKLPAARKSPNPDGARVRGLEKRLVNALKREA